MRKTVFVVDDEATIAHNLADALNRRSYHALAFSSPLEALNGTTHTSPDLLISDFNMPHLDGISLALQITERHPACKVVVMSADPLAASKHPDGSRFRIIAKPFSIRSMISVVDRTLLLG